MIQDIFPSKLNNHFDAHTLRAQDHLLYFDGQGRLLASIQNGEPQFLTGQDAPDGNAVYLFSCDDARFFLCFAAPDAPEHFSYYTIRELRDQSGGKGNSR